MDARNLKGFMFCGWALSALLPLCGCGGDGSRSSGATAGTASGGSGATTSDAPGGMPNDSSGGLPSDLPGELPIIEATGDVPYQLGANAYGVMGGAFLAKAPLGSETVTIDTTQVGKICLTGNVEPVPIPADGSHPPYSTYWGMELGFNLNQGEDGVKTPWLVPEGVVGFWFTLEGPTIPPIRLKATPTGKDPALEQDSCTLVTAVSGQPQQVPFTNMYVQCWNGPQGTGTTDVSAGLVDMGFQVAASTDVPYALDFCVTQLGVIVE